jgi:hypothetical protein
MITVYDKQERKREESDCERALALSYLNSGVFGCKTDMEISAKITRKIKVNRREI